ncbi:MAG: DNA-binding response regulator [Proteobacteria bacterium]|nr:MAG: DNA-binding response regulator [Pseudomonadota bacterium]
MPESTPSRKKVLVVDDEPAIRDSLKLILSTQFDVQTAGDGEEAIQLVENFAPDLVLLDVIMPKLDGIETLKSLRDNQTSVPVVMLTATNTVKTAVQAMKLGAVDFLNKPFDVQELTSLIIQLLDKAQSGTQAPAATRRQGMPQLPADFGSMVGKSTCMQQIFQKISQVAERDATVLITGESGTGKELIAKRVHELSSRKSGPFIAINCAAIPETLIESELFGHEKGAFTHAVERRLGHFELADGGTLFLDEIGELSLNVQVKMLRFLQEQEFYRVGRSKPVRVDVRIIAATNKQLEGLIKEGRFRQDLFYRINVINIAVPALRDRFEDIPELANYFIKKLAPLYGQRAIEIQPDALAALVEYAWPGNVRELENVIESLMALCQAESVTLEELPRKIRVREGQEGINPAVFSESRMNFEEAEKAFETEMILKALKKTNYVQTRAAELLGISRRILKYKMDKLGIPDSPSSELPSQE